MSGFVTFMSIGGFPSFIEDLKVRFEPIGYLNKAITASRHKKVVNIIYIYRLLNCGNHPLYITSTIEPRSLHRHNITIFDRLMLCKCMLPEVVTQLFARGNHSKYANVDAAKL